MEVVKVPEEFTLATRRKLGLWFTGGGAASARATRVRERMSSAISRAGQVVCVKR